MDMFFMYWSYCSKSQKLEQYLSKFCIIAIAINFLRFSLPLRVRVALRYVAALHILQSSRKTIGFFVWHTVCLPSHMSKKLTCKYTATTRRAMPLIMSVAIDSASRELHKHTSNEIYDFHHKYVMARA